MYRKTVLILLAITLSACKFVVTAPPEGSVESLYNDRDCPAGSTCTFDVADVSFEGEYAALPEPGYIFYSWKKAEGHLCGGSSRNCEISYNYLSLLSEEDRVEALASDFEHHLEPVFKPVLQSRQVSPDNAYQLIERSFDITSTLMPLARAQIRAFIELLNDGNSSLDGYCSNGGGYRTRYADKDGNGTLSNADVVFLSLWYCELPGVDGLALGTVRIKANGFGFYDDSDVFRTLVADTSYGDGLLIVREAGNLRFTGKHALEYYFNQFGEGAVYIDTLGERSVMFTREGATPLELDFEIDSEWASDYTWEDPDQEFYEFDSEIRAFDEQGRSDIYCAMFTFWELREGENPIGGVSHGQFSCQGSDGSRLQLDPPTGQMEVDAEGDGLFEHESTSDAFQSGPTRGFFSGRDGL